MQDHLLPDIGKAVVAAGVLGLPAYLLRVPLLLAYLLAGVILGPHLGLGIVQSAQSIATLSEIGLVLLMFILGLEIDLRKLMQAGKAVLVNGVTQFLGCAALAVGFFSLLGFGTSTGQYGLVYLAVAGSLSSTLIVVKILSERMELDTLTSRITLGILVLQDLWAIGFLAVQPNLDNLNIMALSFSLSKAVLLVITGWLLARFVLPRIFALVGKQPELMLVTAMAWCFAVCGLADLLGLSVEMGALVAGVSIASFPYHLDVAAKVSSLRDFFITLFFVSLGLQIPSPTASVMWLSLGVIAFVLFSRILTVFPVLHILKYGNRASLIPALNLSQLSEFALVLAALGVSYGHVNQDLLSAFTISMVITALLSSVIIPSGHGIYRTVTPWLKKLGIRDRVSESAKDSKSHDDSAEIVILGFYREASSLLHELLSRFSKSAIDNLMVVDFNPEAHKKLQKMGIKCKYGDIGHSDTLENLDLSHAKLLICTIPDHFLKGTSNLKLLRTLKKFSLHAKIIVTAESMASAKDMYTAGADYVFVPRLVSARYLADVVEKIQLSSGGSMKSEALSLISKRSEVLP